MVKKPGMGLNTVESAIDGLRKEGIHKVGFVVFKNNSVGNSFWNVLGFKEREDLIYRDKIISEREIVRTDT
ncbi:MAG TPA: hypothetical protein DCO79_03540 [Spirochaeta sp.]|nr:hypothetical protein [Spirochaeta sp.]